MALSSMSWSVNVNGAEKHAIFAGVQSDGSKIYVGKVLDASGIAVPGVIIGNSKKVFFEENGIEKSSENVEYFAENLEGYSWCKSSNGAHVSNGVFTGKYYIGRSEYNGATVVGKVDFERKQLVASHNGQIVYLNNYDVLVYNPVSMTQTHNKVHFQKMLAHETRETEFHSRSDAIYNEKLYIRESNFHSEQKFMEMQNRIQSLELELSNYKNDRKIYEQKISFEQKRVIDLNEKIGTLRSENSVYVRERATYEEKFSLESSRVSKLEVKLQDKLNENSYLLKKIVGLEDALKSEKYQMEVYTKRFKSSLTSSTGGNKGLEEKIRIQQQRIFELESKLEGGQLDVETYKSQLSSYESTIELQKIQVESILKKFNGVNADKEFLIQKLHLASKSLRTYKLEVESMSGQLHNAKGIIAKLQADLARVNAALAKHQAALSSAYMINGELMTKVSGFSTLTQYQSVSDSKLDILGLNFSQLEGAIKSLSFNTSALLEATGSETYMKYIKSSSSESTMGSSEFQSFGAESQKSFISELN